MFLKMETSIPWPSSIARAKGRPRESHHPAAHSRNLHALSTGPLPSRPTHQRMPAPALQPSACGKEPETLSVGRQGWGRGCSTPPVGLGAGQGGAHRGESSAPPPHFPGRCFVRVKFRALSGALSTSPGPGWAGSGASGQGKSLWDAGIGNTLEAPGGHMETSVGEGLSLEPTC